MKGINDDGMVSAVVMNFLSTILTIKQTVKEKKERDKRMEKNIR